MNNIIIHTNINDKSINILKIKLILLVIFSYILFPLILSINIVYIKISIIVFSISFLLLIISPILLIIPFYEKKGKKEYKYYIKKGNIIVGPNSGIEYRIPIKNIIEYEILPKNYPGKILLLVKFYLNKSVGKMPKWGLENSYKITLKNKIYPTTENSLWKEAGYGVFVIGDNSDNDAFGLIKK